MENFTSGLALTWIRASSWLVASIGGVIAAIKAVTELRENRLQRGRELRFKQAEAGKKLLDELFADQDAMRALRMLDSTFHSYANEDRNKIPANKEGIPKAVKNCGEIRNPQIEMIIISLDAFLYFLNLFEHFIEIELTQQEDLSVPVEYYAGLLAEDKAIYVEYMERTLYLKGLAFLNRFEVWKES